MKANASIAGTYPLDAFADDERAARVGRTLKTAAWVCAAPILGLAYVFAAPFAGIAVLAWLGLRTLAVRWGAAARVARNLALFFAAPFVGLAYALAFPFVGAAALVWTGVRHARRPAAS